MSTNSQSKRDKFAGLNMPIDNKPLPERSLGLKTQTPKGTNTQDDKPLRTEEQKNTRKQPNKKGNVQETIYITPDKKRKIAVLTALLDKSKGEVLEEGIDYILDKYKHLLRNV